MRVELASYWNIIGFHAVSQKACLYTREKCDGGCLNCSLQFNGEFCMKEHPDFLTGLSSSTYCLYLISGRSVHKFGQ